MPDAQEESKKSRQSVDWNKVETYLRHSISDLPQREMQVRKFSEGYSNLTYLLTIGDWEGVLRRPPFGKTPPKAHDMEREYRMLTKMNPVFPLAPEPYVYCEDKEVMDKHFYVMEKKNGIVLDDKLPAAYKSSEKAGPLISQGIIQTLVRLQDVDYKTAGLEEMGKPEGFMERQIHGWIKRYERAKTDEIPGLANLQAYLTANIPTNSETTVVHNDFKLNNLVLDRNAPGHVIGVLDWELSTIGDPLSDLGSTIAYWGQPGDPDMGITILTDQPGFYNRKEFVEEYAKASGRDVSNIDFYVAFGFYKLAGILQQIYYRWKTGEIQDERFRNLNKAVTNLFEMAEKARLGRLF
ncbi:phosphotransferase family protein [Planococcus lenghuensis]|uniref:Phosphotransferase family protein n=1 Tax=Planococcus lenghuensis TaxID=2213202 RepID=A0A1Q2L2N3_9BACL|nr:phosphotransferase family protein [Planococcus lenghuensis]AQQ54715.1 phosphotransferase family protein [Planococcus lenghuensis]